MVEQRSLVDALIDPRLGSNAKLAGIERLVDWSQLEPLVSSPRPGRTGRPPHAAPAMLKALYLQALHDLPDPDLEEPLLDRLSFRRFCGFAGRRDAVQTTLCRFGTAAAASGVSEGCLPRSTGSSLRKESVCAGARSSMHRCSRRCAGPRVETGSRRATRIPASQAPTGPARTANRCSDIASTSASTKARASSARSPSPRPGSRMSSGPMRLSRATRRWSMPTAPMKGRRAATATCPCCHPGRPGEATSSPADTRPSKPSFSAMKRLYGKARARCLSLQGNTADFLAFATIYNLRRAAILTAD